MRRVGRAFVGPAACACGLLLVAAACGSGDGGVVVQRTASPPTTSIAPASSAPATVGTTAATTTAPATTTPATTTSATTATSATTSAATTAPGSVRVAVPAGASCRERSDPSPAGDERALARFGPLRVEAALTVDVQDPTASTDPEGPYVQAYRAPGGVLVVAAPPRFDPAAPSDRVTVALVSWTGALRWVRCLDGHGRSVVVAAADAGVDRVLLGEPDTGSGVPAWRALRLADGSDAGTLTALARLSPVSRLGRYALFRPLDGPGRAVRVDLVDGTVLTLPAAPAAATAAGTCGGPTWTLTADGDVEVDRGGWQAAAGIVARWSAAGGWSPGPAPGSTTVRAAFGCDADAGLTGVRDDGSVAWRAPALRRPPYEAMDLAVAGDVTVAQVCSGPSAGEVACPDAALVGIATATGAVRWSVPGVRLLAATPADGFVLANDGALADPPPGWLLLDTRTGKVAGDDQRWAAATFVHPCCDDTDIARRDGGVIVSTTRRTVRAFVPAAAGG